MLGMMNGPTEFIDKMEAETRKDPVVVSTRSRQSDGTEDVTGDRKLQGRHVVKIRVNAVEEVGSTEGVAAGARNDLQSSTNNGQVTPSAQVEVLSVRINDNDNDVESFSKPLVVGRTLKEKEMRKQVGEEVVIGKKESRTGRDAEGTMIVGKEMRKQVEEDVVVTKKKESRWEREAVGMKRVEEEPVRRKEEIRRERDAEGIKRVEEDPVMRKVAEEGRFKDDETTSNLAGQHQVSRVKGAGAGTEKTARSFLISNTTSSNKSSVHPETQSSNQSSSNSVRINVSAPAPGETMFSRNDDDSSAYYSYNQLAYLYSNSGQSSPASDSGTCSDFDANTPPPLPKKKSALNRKVSTIQLNLGRNGHIKQNIVNHEDISSDSRNDHLHKGITLSTSADLESDDDISCDSLNSSELEHQVVSSSSSTSSDPSHHHIHDDLEDVDDGVHDVLSRRRMVQEFGKQKNVPPPLPPKKNQLKKTLEISSSVGDEVSVESNNKLGTKPLKFQEVSLRENSLKSHPQVSRQVSVEERTYEERNSSKDCSLNSTLDQSVSSPASSIYDSFYKFHLNENSELTDDCNSSLTSMKSSVTVDGLDSFAGRKGYVPEGDENATIRSSKGTIRGVKNRVRAGIATFLQMHTNKRWEEKEAGKVVVYTTTMGTVRETYLRCLKVRQIMRTNLVKFEERDAFMSREVQNEIKERMSSEVVALPQVFVEGQHLGDAETVERLNESGELRRILQPYKSPDACITCQVCGGYRLLPCGVCNGSKKSVHRNHFTTELVALKCMNCDEVGLVRCYAC